ncbi:MAG: nitrous oxide reductase accessory protein NosL [Proteobacteria bacterium]|nr:nitrous oxide reductase accessory protein NosL [Pseudomonadota bacterium]MBU1686142.1 nitrous oxide reductase accessory protein NosL [Pseudomonadota bacterium]
MGILFLLVLLAPCSTPAGTAKVPQVDHPIVKPHVYSKHGRCVNCGMKLNMWARTRHSFTLTDGEYHVCSIHCVADLTLQKQQPPKDVQVALYLEPETMIKADQAWYLVNSSATGTMSAVSKIAFASEEAARAFAANYGGTIMSFTEALNKANEEL